MAQRSHYVHTNGNTIGRIPSCRASVALRSVPGQEVGDTRESLTGHRSWYCRASGQPWEGSIHRYDCAWYHGEQQGLLENDCPIDPGSERSMPGGEREGGGSFDWTRCCRQRFADDHGNTWSLRYSTLALGQRRRQGSSWRDEPCVPHPRNGSGKKRRRICFENGGCAARRLSLSRAGLAACCGSRKTAGTSNHPHSCLRVALRRGARRVRHLHGGVDQSARNGNPRISRR